MENHNEKELQDQLIRLREENELLRSSLDETVCGEALVRQQDEFASLIDISRKIVTELDLFTVFSMVARSARELVDAELLIVPMLSESRDEYTYVAAEGTDADEVLNTRFKVSVGMCGWVLQNERSLLFGESSKNWMDEKTLWEEGQMSALLVPLFGRKQIIGGLSALGKRGGGSFTHHDLDLLTIFSNLVSTAIENAKLFSSLSDEIEERKKAQSDIARSLKEKEVLLEEVHHRVKNNMALISSLLHMQSMLVKDDSTKQMFNDCKQRVAAMALVHQKLYQSRDVSNIDIANYITELIQDLKTSYHKHGVSVSEDIEDVNLSLNLLIPFGLIVNEIVSNAFKHAFRGIEKPEIRIALKQQDGNITLSIADNGIGIHTDEEVDSNKTLGLGIIDSLTGQIHGNIERTMDNGVKYMLTFPLKEK